MSGNKMTSFVAGQLAGREDVSRMECAKSSRSAVTRVPSHFIPLCRRSDGHSQVRISRLSRFAVSSGDESYRGAHQHVIEGYNILKTSTTSHCKKTDFVNDERSTLLGLAGSGFLRPSEAPATISSWPAHANSHSERQFPQHPGIRMASARPRLRRFGSAAQGGETRLGVVSWWTMGHRRCCGAD